MQTPAPLDPHARTIVATHTNLQVACATARAALLAWTRVQPKADGPTRLRAFVEVVHAQAEDVDGPGRRLRLDTGQVLRWAVLTTRNGFAVTGRPSVAVSPQNDRAEIGGQTYF